MIYTGDCLDILPTLEADSVQSCVTSPPYWGLRDYGVDGQIGLEPTPEAYVEKLVAVFREVRRVLRDDGTLWLNLGDSYTANGGGGERRMIELGNPSPGALSKPHMLCDKKRSTKTGLKPKDLVGIPWRVAFALQADGWYLRSEIIWAKANPMPESVTDRPTKSHEQIFLLSKNARYYYDAEAVKEPCQSGPSDIRKMNESLERIGGKHKDLIDPLSKASAATNIGHKRAVGDPSGRNRRSVWNINTVPFPGSHFAVFPPAIPEICIKAGSRPGDTILDPFSGAGTTGNVAERLGRAYIGIELNPVYAEMGANRIDAARLPLNELWGVAQ